MNDNKIPLTIPVSSKKSTYSPGDVFYIPTLGGFYILAIVDVEHTSNMRRTSLIGLSTGNRVNDPISRSLYADITESDVKAMASTREYQFVGRLDITKGN